MTKQMSDFQRQFLARGTGQQLYTDVELNVKLSMKIAEVMAPAGPQIFRDQKKTNKVRAAPKNEFIARAWRRRGA